MHFSTVLTPTTPHVTFESSYGIGEESESELPDGRVWLAV